MRKNIIIPLIIQFIATFSIVLIFPVISPYLKSIGLTFLLVGFYTGIYSLSKVISAFTTGIISETIGSKRTIILSLIGLAFSMIFTIISTSKLMVFTSRILHGFFEASTYSAIWILVSSTAGKMRSKGKYVGSANLVGSAASVTASLIAGLVAVKLGLKAPFILSAVSLVFLALFTSLSFKENFTIERKTIRFSVLRSILPYYIMFMFDWYILFSWLTFIPLYIIDIGLNVGFIGFLIALETAIYALMQPLIGLIYDRLGTKANILLTLAIPYALVLTLIVEARSKVIITLLFVILALVSSPLETIIYSNVTAKTSQNIKGLAIGCLFTAGYIGAFIGPLITGILTEKYSYQKAFISLLIPALIIAITALISSKNERK